MQINGQGQVPIHSMRADVFIPTHHRSLEQFECFAVLTPVAQQNH